MKKIIMIIVVLGCLASLASCASKPKALDLESAKAAIDQTGIFETVHTPDNKMLLDNYGIDSALIKNRMIFSTALTTNASLCMVVLPLRGAETELKAQLDAYVNNLEALWNARRVDYPDQYDLVCNRLVTTIDTKEGVYFIYIISSDNETVLEAIQSALVL